MSDEVFKVHRAHKIQDWLEQQCTEMIETRITEHFGVDSTDVLTEEQIKEVITEWENTEDSYISMSLRNCINTWENENDTFLI